MSYYDNTTPTTVSGLRIWLDGSDSSTITSSGSNVSQWTDKSGNGFQFTQASSGSQPTISASGLARQSLSFVYASGSYQYITNTNATVTNTAYTMFAVGKQNASTTTWTGYTYLIKGSPANPAVTTLGARSGYFATFTGDANNFNDTDANSPAQSVQNTFIGAMVVNGSTLTPYFNGTAQNTKNGTTSYPITGFRIGDTDNGNLGQNWSGLVGEILIYNGALGTSDRQKIEGFLAWKWNIVSNLPAGHPYKNSPPVSPVSPPVIEPYPLVESSTITYWWEAATDYTNISSLILTCSGTNGGIVTKSNFTRSHVFSNLTNGELYSANVYYLQTNGISTPATNYVSVKPGIAPSAPLNVVISKSGNSVVASWDPPASDGGSDIIWYALQSTDLTYTFSIEPYKRTFTSTSIANGTYTFVVYAINYVDWGTASAGTSLTFP